MGKHQTFCTLCSALAIWPGASDVVPQELLGEHSDREEEEEAPSQSVQLAHQPILPADLGLVHPGGGQPPGDHVNHLVHVYLSIVLGFLECSIVFLYYYNFFPQWQWHKTRRLVTDSVPSTQALRMNQNGYLFVVNYLSKKYCILHLHGLYCEEFLLQGSQKGEVFH